MKWFRFYSEALHDPRVQRLAPADFKNWLNLLCLANEQEPRGTLPEQEHVAFALRVSYLKAAQILCKFHEQDYIDLDEESGVFSIHNWDKWQYGSDNVTERVRRHRQRGNVSPINRNVSVTPPDTDTEQTQKETDQETDADADDAPAHPFALTYVRRFQERHAGNRPPPVEHAAALAIEREYGSGACIQLGNDLDWSKHPNYMRPILEERRNGKPHGNDRGVDAASTNPGAVAVGVSDMERRRAALAERRRAGVT